MNPSELKIPLSVESYEEKTADDYRSFIKITAELSKISIRNLNSTNLRLEKRLGQNFPSLHFIFSGKYA